MSIQEHKQKARRSVNCKVVTVSDTRIKENDKSGKLMMDLLEAAGHKIVDYCLVKDEEKPIREAILTGCGHQDVEVILTNGGTGIALRDVTIETVSKLYEKEINGFGELFRMLSYQEDIGSAAILSRASAGVIGSKAVFCTPGSSGAVKLAMNKLILPELGHVVAELQKDLPSSS
jgi:molybdopterin adenylyltransferase